MVDPVVAAVADGMLEYTLDVVKLEPSEERTRNADSSQGDGKRKRRMAISPWENADNSHSPTENMCRV